MGLRDLIGRESAERGLTGKSDRQNKFRLTRSKDKFGFHVYSIENTSKKEKILVRRFLLDRFRSVLFEIFSDELNQNKPAAIDKSVTYKNREYYKVRSDVRDADKIIIQEVTPQKGSTGFLSFDRSAIKVLCELMYHKRLAHPNEVLNRIISYHKMFQFTFTEGSESITSDLAIKKDILSHTETYIPALGKRVGEATKRTVNFDDSDANGDKKLNPKNKNKGGEQGLFKSRLAERSGEKSYQIDYEVLFKGNMEAAEKAAAGSSTKRRKSQAEKNSFQIPLMTSDVKHFTQVPFRCEFSTDEIKELRDEFLGDRDNEFYIGFEIIDAIHRKEFGRLKSFRFPLYYLKVKVKESGRNLFIEPVGEGRVFLNHLALANLVSQFDKSVAGHDSLDDFFNTLLAQAIDVEKKLSRIYLTRLLPHSEEIFQRTREVLLGFPGENGKGGILSSLKVLGIECDLESVYLYKTPKINSATSAALEDDMDEILEMATNQPDRFSQSLLGEFLAPELRSQRKEKETFCPVPWIPGALPKSTRRLLKRLDESDLVLLEGPPGTGKTFAIMNLFIHCLCTGKRLLVVSDQKGAIHALTEKLEEYLTGKDRESADAKGVLALWSSAIKVVDQIPSHDAPLSKWITELRNMLKIDVVQEGFWPETDDGLPDQLAVVEREMLGIKGIIQKMMESHLGPDATHKNRVTPKKLHATTIDDINQLCAFVKFISKTGLRDSSDNVRIGSIKHLVMRFIQDREGMGQTDFRSFYDFFAVPEDVGADEIDRFERLYEVVSMLDKVSPRRQETFFSIVGKLEDSEISSFLRKKWDDVFPASAGSAAIAFKVVASLFLYPLRKNLRNLKSIVSNHLSLLKEMKSAEDGVSKQLALMHDALTPGSQENVPLCLEICRFATTPKQSTSSSSSSKQKKGDTPDHSVQEYLERLNKLQKTRDSIVRLQVLANMENISRGAFQRDEKGGTSLATSISTILESLKSQKNIETGATFHSDLKKKLAEAFPIWVCRKQAVPFLFPCVEQSFDLVIVDEATQCRVDDALPLLYRAKKVMVVGDEKQTVLAKNSVVDDYLFKEFSLEEHLRQTQARGIKGGGSHLFGLVKGIKQGHVMLDEHYRCPPEIIQYSNKYVYNDQLRKMQWTPVGAPATVYIDHSEKNAIGAGRRDSGQFKGIETDMVDRYLEYVRKTILKIEKETGEKINVETDVALCYFLLKNEPYVKRVKSEFLQKLNRGSDILDGAGAALQGKERDYIFYFWDVSRSNMMAFRQGDDEDKRKGELNVLMSRPKKRAYHYIHKNFADLDHSRASITDFLWKAHARQSEQEQKVELQPRLQNPGPDFIPWRRSSGQLMASIVENVIKYSGQTAKGMMMPDSIDQQYSVTVGDPKFCVDLMVISDGSRKGYAKSVGIVDLCGFEADPYCADNVIDYYFQLQRATPAIQPVFLFMHELADDQSRAYRRFLKSMSKLAIKEELEDVG